MDVEGDCKGDTDEGNIDGRRVGDFEGAADEDDTSTKPKGYLCSKFYTHPHPPTHTLTCTLTCTCTLSQSDYAPDGRATGHQAKMCSAHSCRYAAKELAQLSHCSATVRSRKSPTGPPTLQSGRPENVSSMRVRT